MTEPVDTPTTAPETAPSRRPRRLAVAGAAGVVAAQVTDEAAARKGIDGLSDCGG